ncbi:MAG: hypothetical protein ABIQ32_08265 [Sphingomicrobium sp.]
MDRAGPAEMTLEAAAAAWFAACLGYSAWLIGPTVSVSGLLLAAAGTCVGFVGAGAVVRRSPDYRFTLAEFEPAPTEFVEADELLLTDEVLLLTEDMRPAQPVEELMLTLEQRLGAERVAEQATEELLLNDILGEIAPDSRVIRLFDPAAMPTAGELQSRIDRHLQNREAPAYPDAAQALHDALADLRRSLR